MEVPLEILENLKCTNCGYYLSCGPIKIRHEDGEALCGRCDDQAEVTSVTQNKQYETVAELLSFPCKYSEFGCCEKLLFSKKNEHPHEQICFYRKSLCPIVERAKCDWLGTWQDLLKHSQEKHLDQVLENPCIIHHDITKSSVINYLLVAFNLLFVIHTKLCLTSGKIFHAVRLLGNSDKVNEFEYQLNIKRNREQQSKIGTVFAEGCLAIEEKSSLCLSINSLSEFFGGLDNIIFEITLKKMREKSKTRLEITSFDIKNEEIIIEEIKNKEIENESIEEKIENIENEEIENVNININSSGYEDEQTKCLYCEEIFESIEFGLFCSVCKILVVFCANKDKGCGYYDLKAKCLKHEKYYCIFNSKCTLDRYTSFSKCNIEQGTLFEHLILKHATMQNTIEGVTRCTNDENKRLLLTSDIGVVIVEYCDNGYTNFNIYSPLTSKELKEYSCTVEVSVIDEETSHPEVHKKFENKYDWTFNILISADFDIKVNIDKM